MVWRKDGRLGACFWSQRWPEFLCDLDKGFLFLSLSFLKCLNGLEGGVYTYHSTNPLGLLPLWHWQRVWGPIQILAVRRNWRPGKLGEIFEFRVLFYLGLS